MPKLVCVNCQTQLQCETSGTTTIDMASFGVYKVWDSDVYKCPGCGFEVVSGFGDTPLRQDHYAADFQQWLERFLATARRIVYNYEKPNPIIPPDINPDYEAARDDWISTQKEKNVDA